MVNVLNKTKLWKKNNNINSWFFPNEDFTQDNFLSFVKSEFKVGVTYSILVKVKYNGTKFGMTSKQIGFNLLSVNNNDSIKSLYDDILKSVLFFIEWYDCYIDYVEIMYIPINLLPKLKVSNIKTSVINKQFSVIKDTKSNFNTKLLPFTMDDRYFGSYINVNDYKTYLDTINYQKNILFKNSLYPDSIESMYLYNESFLIITYKNNNLSYNNSISNSLSYVREIYNVTSGVCYLKVKDVVVDNDINIFERTIGDTTVTIDNSKIIGIKSCKKLDKISYRSLGYKPRSNPSIGSFDIETYTDNKGVSKIYALGYYTPIEKSKLYYIDKDLDSKLLLINCIEELLCSKFNNFVFYVHNSGRFDFIFMLNIIKSYNNEKGYDHYIINTIYRNNKMLKLEIKHYSNNFKVSFVDSYNLLNRSLRDLCLAFKLNVVKDYFPYSFVNKNTLNYKGDTPDITYWGDISKEKWNKIYQTNWDLKQESLKYLDKDLVCLYQVMREFNTYMFRKYGIEVTKSLTISRLAMNIFLKFYIKDSLLPIVIGNMYDDIRESYYGGITEVYKPYGECLYYYDVNSLYPYASLNPLPGINCVYISNDINITLDKLFGFFYCEIECNNNYLGLLPYRNKSGICLPNGKWCGWYFSEELKFAQSNNYNIKVLKGYNFDKSLNVFKEYVEHFYKIKSNTIGPTKAISKSLLNNLIGRFGLDINKPVSRIVDKEQLDYILSTRECKSINNITTNDYLVTYLPEISKFVCTSHGLDYFKVLNSKNNVFSDNSKNIKDRVSKFKDISISTASAITAYARVYMSKIKLNILKNGGNIYYSDTDSIVTDIELPNDLVSNEIGKFKLEYNINRGYFISGKLYYLVLDNSTYTNGKDVIVKAKQVKEDFLKEKDFENLYKGLNIKTKMTYSDINLEGGYVTIGDKQIDLKHDSYTKRSKVYKDNVWVDTKPIYIDL